MLFSSFLFFFLMFGIVIENIDLFCPLASIVLFLTSFLKHYLLKLLPPSDDKTYRFSVSPNIYSDLLAHEIHFAKKR